MSAASYLLGIVVNIVGNIIHQINAPLDLDYYDPGATWQDFALTIAGSNIGTLVNFGAIPPDQLGNTIRDHIGPNSSGAPWIHAITDWMELPLEGNR